MPSGAGARSQSRRHGCAPPYSGRVAAAGRFRNLSIVRCRSGFLSHRNAPGSFNRPKGTSYQSSLKSQIGQTVRIVLVAPERTLNENNQLRMLSSLTHNFLEYYCILNCVCSLSYHSLNVVNKDVKVESRKLLHILTPLFSLLLSFLLTKLEIFFRIMRQKRNASVREYVEHLFIWVTVFFKHSILFGIDIKIYSTIQEIRVVFPRLKNLEPNLGNVTNSVGAETNPGSLHLTIILEIS